MADQSFPERVRAIVRAIPRGETLSYSQVAERAGRPKAARAVARIMAANYDESIPCHRVIRSSGEVGGYNRGGAAGKRAILRAEGYPFRENVC